MILRCLVAGLLMMIALSGGVNGLQTELSIIIEAGRRECFFQQLLQGMHIETDYQVISGGDMDISYWISSPTNRVVYTELRKQGGQANFQTQETGEFRFCFDNSFSRFAAKQVFFFFTTNDKYIDPHFPAASENDDKDVEALLKDQLGDLEDKLENFKVLFL